MQCLRDLEKTIDRSVYLRSKSSQISVSVGCSPPGDDSTMKIALAAAFGAVLAATTTSTSFAAKLFGQPFVLLDGTVAELSTDNVQAYLASNDQFGLLYGTTNEARTSAQLYLQLFKDNGKPSNPKALAFDQSRPASSTAFKLTPAGAIVLANGKTIVAANLTNGSDSQTRKFLGQTMAVTARDGEPFAFEQSGAARVEGRVMQLKLGGGIVFWHQYNASTSTYESYVQNISRTGFLSTRLYKITDRPINATILRPYLSGFIETTSLPDTVQTTTPRYSYYRNPYGYSISKRKPWKEDKTMSPSATLGLDRSTLGQVTFDKLNGGMKINLFRKPFSRYPSGRTAITGKTSLDKSVSYARAVIPMTEARFTSAWVNTTRSGEVINVRVYSQNGPTPGEPIQIGKTAKIKLPLGSSFHQLLPLVSGNILVTFVDSGSNQLKGQLIRP